MTSSTPVHLLLWAGDDPRDALLSASEGGSALVTGLVAHVAERTAQAYQLILEVRPPQPVAAMADAVERDGRIFEAADVVVLSLAPDLPDAGGDLQAWTGDLQRVIVAAKAAGTRVLVFNGSTVDPSDGAVTYAPGERTPAWAVHRLDFGLLRLSVEDGISIIDADRILAEMGAASHVSSLLSYSAEACLALRDETARVLQDYGFFDDRPLLEQTGSGAR